MSAPAVGVGLIGCGTIAYWSHLQVLRRLRGATLVAAADPDARARDLAARTAGVPALARADELLARPDVAAVVIAAPTHLHAQLAVEAASAGKHFYLEKPIATTAADAERVLQAAARSGVRAAVGFNRRMHPLFQQARDLVRAGRLGRLYAVQTSFCEPVSGTAMPAWKRQRATGGGVLLDLASHHADLVRWILADDIATVSAAVRSDESEHDSARVEMTTRRGVEVQSWFSFRSGLADYLELLGERGSLRVDRHSPRLVLRVPRRFGYGMRRLPVLPTRSAARWRVTRLVRPSVDPSYRRALQAFVDHLHGEPPAPASLADGVQSLAIVLAAERSVDGRLVEVACASS